jgi:hypothetical protein
MIYKWTTVKPVIGKIVRDIRHIDGSYFDDLTDWIAEAIQLMKTSYQLELKSTSVRVDFHHAALPCMLESVIAVSFRGARIMDSGSAKPLKSLGYRGTEFKTSINPAVSTPGGQISLQSVECMPSSPEITYRLNYNKIECSLESAELEVYYYATPTDEDGFPMIPDNQNYKEAIHFYCRMKMIGTGFKDPVFKYQDCEQRFDLYLGRAIAEITYPTVDAIHRNIQTNNRLIPTQYHWENFGQSQPAEGDYNH